MALISATSVEVIPVNKVTKSAILIYGSQDGRTWIPVSGTLDYRSFIDYQSHHLWN